MNQASQLIASQYRNGELTKRLWSGVIYNIKEFGAKGDGSDDSYAIQKALIAANGDAILFPSGVYDLSNMNAASGKVKLLGFSDSTIIGFKYDEAAPSPQGYQQPTSSTDSFFSAEGLTFQGIGNVPGLSIKNKSYGGVIRSFRIFNCKFRGPTGLITENCLTSVIGDCDFIENQYAWKSLSCTNFVVTDTQFFAPIIGVYIGTSDTDTANRKGGENIKFQGCTWIDGVIGIQCLNHNYLWLSSCLIDYFNCGIYMQGSKWARFDNIYIGYNDSNRTGRTDYIAPTQFGALYACGDSATSRSSGVETINSEFVAYGTSSKPPVKLDGSTVSFTGIEEVDISYCRFASDNQGNTMPNLLQIIKANDVIHSNNKYVSAYNNNVTAPWVFTNIVGGRILSERNNFKNVFNSSGTIIPPASGYAGNEIFESSTITLATNGTSTTNAASYTYKQKFDGIPRVIATAKSAPSGIPTEKLNVAIDAQDANLVFVRVAHIDGTTMASGGQIVVNIIVVGE